MKLNEVIIGGNLTRDPEEHGNMVILRLALNGYKEDETTFVDVKCFKGQADFAKEYLKKGSLVAVVGRLQQDNWEKDGKRNSVLRVICEKLQGVRTSVEPPVPAKSDFDDQLQSAVPF